MPQASVLDLDKIKTTIQMMQLAFSGVALHTIEEAKRMARQFTYQTEIIGEDTNLMKQGGIEASVVDDKSEFFKNLDQDVEWDPDIYQTQTQYMEALYVTYNKDFWNQLNNVIFGAEACKAYEQQKDYLLTQIVKSKGLTIEAAFRRIGILCNLLEYFPPSYVKEGSAS